MITANICVCMYQKIAMFLFYFCIFMFNHAWLEYTFMVLIFSRCLFSSVNNWHKEKWLINYFLIYQEKKETYVWWINIWLFDLILLIFPLFSAENLKRIFTYCSMKICIHWKAIIYFLSKPPRKNRRSVSMASQTRG